MFNKCATFFTSFTFLFLLMSLPLRVYAAEVLVAGVTLTFPDPFVFTMAADGDFIPYAKDDQVVLSGPGLQTELSYPAEQPDKKRIKIRLLKMNSDRSAASLQMNDQYFSGMKEMFSEYCGGNEFVKERIWNTGVLAGKSYGASFIIPDELAVDVIESIGSDAVKDLKKQIHIETYMLGVDTLQERFLCAVSYDSAETYVELKDVVEHVLSQAKINK